MAHERKSGRLAPFIREYRIELAAMALIVFAIFLLIEPWEIRETLVRWLAGLEDLLLGMVDQVIEELRVFTLSDLTGLILLIMVGAFSLWRIHYRLSRSPRLQPDVCPRCQAPLYRVHRSMVDRLLGFVLRLELRRYRCTDGLCNWTGLRLRGEHHHHARRRRSEASAEGNPASEVRG